ncbi:MAG: MBL fold metallo-hydrolase [Bdellovibrionota bacterium]
MQTSKATLSQINLRIGPYELKAVPTGEFGLDGGAMFGTVPKVLWSKTNPPDEANRIPMEARALLLKSKDRNILIDTGNGSDFTEKYGDKMGSKFAEMYAVDPSKASLLKSLKQHGLSPEDITDVILTHLHFDHAGGATCAKDGKIVPTFPKAKYYVQKKNLEIARNPNIREKASYLKPNFEPLVKAGVLNLLDGDVENLFPNVSVLVSNGHTEAQQIVKVADANTGILYAADVIPTSTHIRSAWIMGYDLDPLTIIKEKRAFLKEAVQNSWFIYFEHDPYCDLSSVEAEKDDFKAKERFHLS